MKYAEFWILETAVKFGVPFSRIVGPRDGIEAQWNKPYHNLSRSDMLNLLDRLARDGDIVATDDGDIVATDDGDSEFIPDRQQIESWLVYDHPGETKRWYHLTPQGGERWERFSCADWDRYHSFEWNWEEENVLEIAATTRENSERAFRYVVPWNSLRVFPESVGRPIRHPWSATYWKTLEVGYAVRFKCEYVSEVDDSHPLVRVDYDYFDEWYAKHPDTPRMGPI